MVTRQPQGSRTSTSQRGLNHQLVNVLAGGAASLTILQTPSRVKRANCDVEVRHRPASRAPPQATGRVTSPACRVASRAVPAFKFALTHSGSPCYNTASDCHVVIAVRLLCWTFCW